MGQKMKNAPVYFTIAQVRYNPILSLESYINAFQENLRKAGYPDFKKGTSMVFNLTPGLGGEGTPAQPPPVQRSERYTFSNMEGTRGFILEQNAMSFQATDYDVFETFAGTLIYGLELLHKAVTLSFSERIGVRYLDAVVPRDGETLYQYLIPEAMGLYEKLEGTIQHSFSETVTRTTAGQVLSRSVIQQGPLGFPPDLQPIGLHIAQRFAQVNGLHAIVDTDGSYEGRETFDLTAVKSRLNALHDEITKAFRVTVTKHALDIWA